MADELTLEQVRDRLRHEAEMVERDSHKYAECAYHSPAYVLEDSAEALDATITERDTLRASNALLRSMVRERSQAMLKLIAELGEAKEALRAAMEEDWSDGPENVNKKVLARCEKVLA